MTKRKAFIIGSPISHSLSPQLHGFWLRQYGIDGSYEAFDIKPDYLHKVIKKLANDGYVGGNITIPHKEKAMMICDEIDEIAQNIGAINTLSFREGRIFGSNTDGFGFLENVKENVSRETFSVNQGRAMVLGAGGAARAIIYSLKSAGYEVTLCNRTQENAEKLAAEFDCGVTSWDSRNNLITYNMLVNTTSLGMLHNDPLNIDLSTLPQSAIVCDIVYNPLETELLVQAKMRGLQIIDGLGMLLYQAIPGFELWFGKRPEVTSELREHMIRCLNMKLFHQS